MPRDGSGVYVLPPGNPVVPNTIIESVWANSTMSDIATAMSDSLSRSGKGGMTASLRGPDGSAAEPTFSFTNEPATGRYRASDGVVVEAVDGQPIVRYTTTGLDQWDFTDMVWVPLTPRDAINTPFDPSTSALVSTNVQAAIEEVLSFTGGIPHARDIPFDDTNVYYGAPTVQLAFEVTAQDIQDNFNALGGLDSRIQVNESDILNLQGRMVTVEQRSQQNLTDIAALELRFDDFYTDEFIVVRNRSTSNESRITTNESDISDIKFVNQQQDTAIGNLQGDIARLDQEQTVQDGDISSNQGRISTIENDWFQGASRLAVAHGGTNATSSTGSGSVVLRNGPDFTGTPTISNNAIATQAFVTSQGYLDTGDITQGSNANGNYIRIRAGGVFIAVQWGLVEGTGCSRNITFPIAFANTAFSVALTYRTQPACGTNVGNSITGRNTTTVSMAVANTAPIEWIAVGKAN